ncbi:tail fiber protein [Mucilaginibacter jinjuensis]|uniref:Tail fiber protein n=1 Tax=Mucilaginibacter jinjuensis TaxID=1176721 RepID=A0ABY7TC31_9SPHI|nr:tail fiber protein [Mucilaginibacter jinjuensis]WCT13630.1 tail fiber protein [Mucilaginibacter jinjuensis]
MKKVLLLMLSILTASYCYAQNSNPWPLSGNVGIGISNPGFAPLDVRDNNSVIQLRSTMSAIVPGNNNGGAIYFGVDNQNNSSIPTGAIETSWGGVLVPQIGIGVIRDGLRANMILDYNNNTLFRNGSVSNMIINSSGNVGIGTTNPSEKLTISDPGIAYNATTGVIKLLFDSGGGRGGMGFEKETFNTAGLRFYTQYGFGSSIEKMRITANGYVGIGTTQPDKELTVNGTIHANEVLVDTNVPHPDYVFDRDYDLTSLKDVKTYIDKNHHLPEIPSAAQVAKDGINLGEMNAKLLKKIEELTLYLIEKDAQIDKQESQNISQQQQIDQMKIQIKELLTKASEK